MNGFIQIAEILDFLLTSDSQKAIKNNAVISYSSELTVPSM